MSVAEVVEQLRALSNAERLAVIEAATVLIRRDLPGPADGGREGQLRAAALAARDLYEPGGELAEWSDLDAEDFADDAVPG